MQSVGTSDTEVTIFSYAPLTHFVAYWPRRYRNALTGPLGVKHLFADCVRV